MTKEDILHLGAVSRIKLADGEVEQLRAEIDAILAYVGQVQEIAASGQAASPVPPLRNVFRSDEVTNEPGSYTADLTDAFPEQEKGYLKVKKILNPDS